MKTSLVIMAAGIGSRFGTGIKQLEPIGAHGEIIMDYSIHDAIKAGFNKIIFVIRKDIELDFKEKIGDRIENICNQLGVEVWYAYQNLCDIPNDFSVPSGRTKPWGTGQAILVAKHLIREPFAVINADDYYGKEAFIKLHDYLVNVDASTTNYCMAGFILKNTLSDHGGVTRGICQVDDELMLTDVVEMSHIEKTKNGISADGKMIDGNCYVSMNMWGLTPIYLQQLEEGFSHFFANDVALNPLKAEYLLPIHIGQLLKKSQISVKVLETKDKWFGVTYKEDKKNVVDSFHQLIEEGVYLENLFDDLF